MTHTPSPPCSGLLPFGGYSVRYIIDADGTPWLVARDFLAILRLDVSKNPGRWLARTPDADKSFRDVQSVKGPQRSLVVSVRGAVALTRQRKRSIDQTVRAFLNREAAHLLPKLPND